MIANGKSWFSQFTLRHLFIFTWACALIAYLVALIPAAQPDESKLASADRDVVHRIRGNGLNIAMTHMCGMGDLAAFDVVRCDDRKYHITQIYIQHRDPVPFLADIASLPHLTKLDIGDVYSTNVVTITDPSKLDRQSIEQILADITSMHATPGVRLP